MKVIVESPVAFDNSAVLAPEDLNRCFNYAADVVADVSSKRYAICAVVFPFVNDIATGITDASSKALRTWRFNCPVNCQIVRCFLDGNITSGARLDINISTPVGDIPPGATVPLLSVPAGSSMANDVGDINVQKVQLSAGNNYELTASGSNFVTGRCDVVLHVAVDRWYRSGNVNKPSFTPTLYIDGVADDAVTLANRTALNIAANDIKARGMACFVLHARDFNNATPAADLTFLIPLYVDGVPAKIVRTYLTSGVATAAAGSGAQAIIKSNLGVTLSTLTASNATDAINTATSATPMLIDGGDPSDAASDYSVTFSALNSTTIQRAALLVWVEW